MMEQSLPQSRQFFPPTTNKFHFVENRVTQRGNISIFAVVWCALCVLGCVGIVRATQTTLLRGHAQFVADAVALAYADKGARSGEQVAEIFGVSIVSVSTDAEQILTLTVRGDGFEALSSAG